MLNATEFVIQTLIEDQKMSHADADKLRAYIIEHEIPFDEAIMRLNIASARDVAVAKSVICEYPFVELDHFDVDIRNSRRLSKTIAERLRVFPLMVLGDIATVAMEDPLDLQAIDELRQALRKQIDPVVVDALKLRSLIVRAYTLDSGGGHESVSIGDDLEISNDQEPIVAAVNQILYSAAEFGASDIHLNPDEKQLHLRYRIDGVLQTNRGPDKSMHDGMIQRLKVMSNLDVTQTRRPQDGKFRFKHKGTAIDVRLSLLPTIHGENAVMRLLSSASTIGTVADLGMPADVTKHFGEMITKPHGIILVTGPTGSGKTTTLYAALSRINTPDKNILTIEDPVEYQLEGIGQMQVNPKINFTFASGLRATLRQDPDVVLVGEIRDLETAEIAVQASLTGHLVFSTVHTNDSASTVTRMLDIGVEP
ncbi:MAG: type II/IV secretion system protein, partial [Phycisphaerales bacterium]|nr:type II/IV secretion system protein [Phycisphaerales bacterium]